MKTADYAETKADAARKTCATLHGNPKSHAYVGLPSTRDFRQGRKIIAGPNRKIAIA